MPFYPDPEKVEGPLSYIPEFYWESYVAEYLGVTVMDVLEYDIVDYLALVRDAFISNQMKTKDGQEYLRKCKLYEDGGADYKALRKFQKHLGGK